MVRCRKMLPTTRRASSPRRPARRHPDLREIMQKGEPMNILVTGAAGFLGQRLIRALLERGELHTGGQSRPIARITALDAVEPAADHTRVRVCRATSSAARCWHAPATAESTACSTSRRWCRARPRRTTTSACASTSTARVRCWTPAVLSPCRRPSCSQFGRRVRRRSARGRAGRHDPGAAIQLRRAEADRRTAGGRLRPARFHRRARGAAADDRRPAGQTKCSGIELRQRHRA